MCISTQMIRKWRLFVLLFRWQEGLIYLKIYTLYKSKKLIFVKLVLLGLKRIQIYLYWYYRKKNHEDKRNREKRSKINLFKDWKKEEEEEEEEY